MGSGGPFGVGLGDSHQKFYWVPNAHTDAIFAIIGEELGFVGSICVLGLFGILAWRGFLVGWQAPDPFGRLFATGLTCMLALQALVNMAVVTNSVPYTGITLPLVSFGGSSTVISLLAVGLLLNISCHRYRVAAAEPPDRDAARPSRRLAPARLSSSPVDTSWSLRPRVAVAGKARWPRRAHGQRI